MSVRAFAVLVGMVLAFAGAARAASLADGFSIESYKPGAANGVRVDHWRLARDGESAPFELVTAVFPRGTMTIAPIGRSGASKGLFKSVACPGAMAVVNGGFYLRDEKGARPLGLVRAGGRTLNAASGRRFGGFLVSEGGEARVLRRDARVEAERAEQALESSPLVVEDGKSGIRSDDGDRFDRVAVGTAADGALLVVGAFGADQNTVTMGEFARLALAASKAVGREAKDLLAMDGGPSAHIWLPASQRFFGYAGSAYLPNAVCLRPRR